jgi:hypothetical protein
MYFHSSPGFLVVVVFRVAAAAAHRFNAAAGLFGPGTTR